MASVYVIDTSSLIELNQHYPQDTFSGLWDKLEALVQNDRMIAPKEVLREISPGKSPDLHGWCKNNAKMFIENNREILMYVAEIMANHAQLVPINKSGPVADPFIIALARSRKNNLTNSKIVIVTQEAVGSKYKIPFVSRTFEITCVKLMELIRQENWKF